MFEPDFFGTATIGEKGQIVIPAEARASFDLKVGDKLLVVSGPGSRFIMLMKPDVVKEMAKKMSKSFDKFQSMADQI